MDAGTGGVDIDCLGATGDLSLDTAGGDIEIGVNAAAGDINVGTNATARTITVGNTTGATGLALKAGSGKVAVTGDMTVSGDSTLGDANSDQTTINGAMKLSIFNGSDATDQSTLRSYCTSSTAFDYGRTDAECVAQPSMQWNGQVLYVRQAYTGESGSQSGSAANAFFNNDDKWYFCESGSWYPSPFNT